MKEYFIEEVKRLLTKASKAGHSEAALYLQDVLIWLYSLAECGGKRVLLVEDGSVDTEELEQKGYDCIVYRKDAAPPQWLGGGYEK